MIDRQRKLSFGEDFRRFFVRGLAALLPTLITLWLIIWAWNFLWEYLGRHLIAAIKRVWLWASDYGLIPYQPAGYIGRYWDDDYLRTKLVGVLLAVMLVYMVGVIVGNFIGRTAWRLAELIFMKIPFVRAIYPTAKQVTDFLLSERRGRHLHESRVVAVQPHEQGIWSIGFVTGGELKQLSAVTGEEMITVFVPSTPTAFTGYVLIVPRQRVVELPLKVEDAMRLLITGGVMSPASPKPQSGAESTQITTMTPAPAPASGS